MRVDTTASPRRKYFDQKVDEYSLLLLRDPLSVFCFSNSSAKMVNYIRTNMTRGVRRFAVVVAILALQAGVLFAQRNRISRPIDRDRTVTLRGNIHVKARPLYDQGVAEPSFEIGYITLRIKPSPEQQTALDQLLTEQQDPSSANFHKWVTPEQYADRFGLSRGDTSKIVSWLQSEGFTINDVARGRHWVAFSGTAGLTARALGVEIHRYMVDGETHFANATEPSIPATLVDVVSGFDGLNDFPMRSMIATKRSAADPTFENGGQHYLAPDDLGVIYNIAPLYNGGVDGSGQKIVIVGQGSVNVADIQAFRAQFHLPPNDPQTVLVGPDPGTNSSFLLEADLDIEWAGAIAPKANIIYVYARSVNTAAQFAIDNNLAPVISWSYGLCELEASPALRSVAQQANAQGITWLAASGDSGAAACEPQGVHPQATRGLATSFPASLPEVTAVGGSQFDEGKGNFWIATNGANSGSARSYIPETAWNESSASGLLASGGGTSIFFSKPAWQAGAGVPNDNVRDVPDISLSSALHDGYFVVSSGLDFIVGGTSAAAPSFAGIIALLNQFVVANGYQAQPGLGNINPALYRLAQTTTNVFHDITTGNNSVACVQSSPSCAAGSFGYAAGPGYDLATGLGSVDANNLITQWNPRGSGTSTTLAADSSRVNWGGTLRLTAIVSAVSSGVPSGPVTFNVGATVLGSAQLAASGKSMMAALAVSTSQLPYGSDAVTAIYDGDKNFSGSSASITIDVGLPIGNSAVVPAITPNPVFESAVATNSWSYTVGLTEAAGLATVLTDYTINGVSHIEELTNALGTSTLPARGSLTARLTLTDLAVPIRVMFGFKGVDASGYQWSQQVSVPFYGPLLGTSISFGAHPATVLQDLSAEPSCQWSQQLTVEEKNGFTMQLTKLVAGSNDISNQIQQIFGTTHLAPFGGLTGRLCWTGVNGSQTSTLEIDAITETGGVARVTQSQTLRGPAASSIPLKLSPALLTLSVADSSQTATASLSIDFSGSTTQSWTVLLFPANRATNWLKVSALSGDGPSQLSLTASGAGLANGVYHAAVTVTSMNATPPYVTAEVVFVVGASATTNITSISNGASNRSAFAPGMLLNVAGTDLAPSSTRANSPPLDLSMSGVSATINGVSAPLYSISPSLLNIQIPYEIGAGTAVLGVNNNGKVSSYSFQVAPSAPGIFTSPDGSLAPSVTGGRGQALTLYITGEGETLPALFAGAAPFSGTPVARLPKPRLPVIVSVGGITATTLFTGIPAGLVGVTQIDFTIPQSAPLGSQPVVVTVGGVASQPANLVVTP